MASAAEQLAASINFGAIAKATELKKRLWFTFGALIIYRLGTYIPLPGIDPVILEDVFRQQAAGIIGMFNMFSGGALSRFSVVALGIMPYISASIIMQLLSVVDPKLKQLKNKSPIQFYSSNVFNFRLKNTKKRYFFNLLGPSHMTNDQSRSICYDRR